MATNRDFTVPQYRWTVYVEAGEEGTETSLRTVIAAYATEVVQLVSGVIVAIEREEKIDLIITQKG